MKSNKIILKLAWNQSREKRNVLTVIAIVLTSILFSVLFTVAVSMMNSFEMQTIKQTNNSAHAAIMYINDEKYNRIKKNTEMYDVIGYEKIISETIISGEQTFNNCVLVYMDEPTRNMTFCNMTEGKNPTEINEIGLDKECLKNIDPNLNVGDEIVLTLGMGDQYITEKFKVSGTYESNKLRDVSFMLISEKFMKQFVQKYTEQEYMVHAYLQFDEKTDIENSLEALVQKCNMQNEQYNVNWAYLSNSVNDDMKIKLGILCVIIIIIMTGYLLINNIYQITFLNSARYFGLLKTIGFSMGQLRKIIFLEAFLVSVIGICIGNILGYAIGYRLYPIILQMTNVEYVSQGFDYRIFVLTFLFTFMTVSVSILKPCEYLKKVSPIEATRL